MTRFRGSLLLVAMICSVASAAAKLTCHAFDAGRTDYESAKALDHRISVALQERKGDPARTITATREELERQNDENEIETFHVDMAAGYLLIPVYLIGCEHLFLLDTGCSNTIFDDGFKSILGPPRGKARTDSGTVHETFEFEKGAAGRERLPLPRHVVCADLSWLRKSTELPIAGIIGMDFLEKYVVRFDPDLNTVTLLRSGEPSSAATLKLEIISPRLRAVSVSLPGIGEVPFAIDTGCSVMIDGFIGQSLFDQLCASQSLSQNGTGETAGFDGRFVRRRQASVSELAVGPLTYGGKRRLCFFERPGDGNALGMGFLLRHKVTLDFPNGTAFVEKSRYFDLFSNAGPSGVEVIRHWGHVIVTAVAPGQSGESGGIQEGDSILEINGKKTATMSTAAIRMLLARCTDGLKLKISPEMGDDDCEKTLPSQPDGQATFSLDSP